MKDVAKGDVIMEEGLVRIVNSYKRSILGSILVNVFVDYRVHPKDIPLEHFIFMYDTFCEVHNIKPDADKKALYVMRVNDAYINNYKSPRGISFTVDDHYNKLMIRPHCFESHDDKYKDKKTRYFDDSVYTRFVGYTESLTDTIRTNERFAGLVAKHFNK